MNGIPRSLIERAKARVEHDKIVLERTIASLQKEKSNILQQSKSLTSARQKADATSQALEKTNEKIQAKLQSYQELFDRNVKRIQLGKRIEALTDAYFFKKQTKKAVLAEVVKIVEMESARRAEKAAKAAAKTNTKAAPTDAPKTTGREEDPEKLRAKMAAAARKALLAQQKQEAERMARAETEIEREIAPIREQKAAELAAEREEQQKPKLNLPIAPGDRVRLEGGFSVGKVDRIERDTAYIDYGWFITQAPVKDLELVEKKKAR